jgi:hypothetical protein
MSQALHLIAIAKKNRATRLDIGNCNLTELPDEVFELAWLKELIVTHYYSPFWRTTVDTCKAYVSFNLLKL